MIEFTSLLQRIKASKKTAGKIIKENKRRALVLLAFIVFVALLAGSANATIYYSRANGNWNVPGTWSTVTYGNAVNAGTFPQAGDAANIGNGYTVNINTSVNCGSINIGQGISGILQFASAANYTVNVSTNVTLNTGAKFWYNILVNRTHTLNIGGNFTNFGIVDFYITPTQVVNLIFNTGANSVASGIGTWDFNTVTLNKTSGPATLDVQNSGFETGIKTFIGTTGTYIHNNAGTYNINPTAATFTIGPNMTFKVPLGTMKFASVADNVYLQGSLYVNGGNVFMGTAAGLQGLRTDQNGATVPYLEVSAGNLTVYGGITYGVASAAEPFSFMMTGGTILLNSGATGTNRQVFFVNDVVNSSFVMSGGSIVLEKPNIAGVGTIDASICGTNGTVTTTGGTIQFGDNATPSGKKFNFKPFANATYPNIRLTGLNATLLTLAPSTGSISDFKLLSLYIDANKTFDIRSISGIAGDSKQMTLLGTANGTDAIYNDGTYLARTGNVTFNTSGAQGIGGTVVTTFYNLAINNSNDITLNIAANVSNFLSMVNGKLLTTAVNVLTCQSGANANLGSNTSYVDGPMVHTWATAVSTTKTYPIGKSTSFRPVVLTVQHSNATSVTYRAEIINATAMALPFTLPPTIAGVSNVRYVQFNRQAVANFTNGIIQMYYDVDDGVANKNTLLVAHDDGVSQWQNYGGTATANWTGNITSNLFTNFNSYFSLGNPPGGGNPLPVELSGFNVKAENKNVLVTWTTQSEINSDYFTVERAQDNIHYSPVATIPAHGTTTVMHQYSITDREPFRGTSYYRLKQTDFDGHITYFHPASVFMSDKKEFLVFPNPSNGSSVSLYSSGNNLRNYQITVQDLTGKQIPATISTTENQDEMKLSIGELYRHFGSMYIITAINSEEVLKEKLIIGKE